MKKALIIAAVAGASFALVAVIALAVVGFAYAQTGTTPFPRGSYGQGRMGRQGGYGMMNNQDGGTQSPGFRRGGGMMGGMIGSRWANGGTGTMHPYMIEALAEGLNMSQEDLQARIDKGETPYQVAQSQGMTGDQIKELFVNAHDQALDAAVKAGLLTQEQADFMDQRMESMWQNGVPGAGFGPCHGAAQNTQTINP
jgi:hypothetical protein